MTKRLLKFALVLVTGLMCSFCSSSLQAQTTNIWDFYYTGTITYWTVPSTAYYDISAYGAQGGGSGGLGAVMGGVILLTQGDVLNILVGGSGSSSYAGGGGGSFVIGADNTPLVVAGGGGGATFQNAQQFPGLNGSTNTSGNASAGSPSASGGIGGTGGGIAGNTYYGGGGGGGFSGNGASPPYGTGGLSYLNGGLGGAYGGGYGGGGSMGSSSAGGGGGGGGFSGGGGGWGGTGIPAPSDSQDSSKSLLGKSAVSPSESGGGGGSYLAANASNVVMIAGMNGGNGQVTIAGMLVDLLVGNSASIQSTNFTGVSYVFNNIFIGCNAGDSNNSISVANAGTVLDAKANCITGQNGSANSLLIANGGIVLNSGAGVIGLNATASGNSAVVTGNGSTWSNGTALLIGDSGSGNRLTVEAGAQVLEGGVGVSLGYNAGSSDNALLVDGTGSILSSSTDLVVGYSGNSNSVVISNGATMTNGQQSYGGVIGFYSGASNNSVVVTGNGSTWNDGGDLLLGWSDSGNNLTITNGGTVTSRQINYGGVIGFNAGVSGNSVMVTGKGSTWSNAGDLLVGVSGSGNSMVIANGGSVSNAQVNYGGGIGFNGGSSNNSVLVTGGGSAWTNRGDLLVGVSGSGNSMVISNGATVVSGEVNYGGVIGLNSNSTGNSVLVTGSGSTWSNSGNLTIGYSGNGTLTIANGGSVSASAVTIASQAGSSGTINFGSLGGSDTAGNLIAPLISFGSGSGTINFNQADTLAATGFSGNGSINQLGNGTTILIGSNTYTGTTTVSAGTLLANNTNGSAVGASTVHVNGGTLGGTGIIAGATTISSGGTLAGGSGGSGGLSFTGGLSLESGSTTSFTIHSANDFTSIYLVGNTVNYGGQLVFDVGSYNPIAGNVFKLFNMIGGATESGNFFSVEIGSSYLTGLNGVWSGTNAGATYQFDDATGSLTVTQATPRLLVGDNASNQSTNFTGGSNTFYSISIGINAGNSNNSVTLSNSGTLLAAGTDIIVGVGGSGNGMLVSGGALVANGQASYGGVIGLNAGSSNNSVLVTGGGSAWTNSGDLLVGMSGSGNSMVISNGATVFSGEVNYGGVIGLNSNSTGNSVLVTGSGSTWSNSGNLTIGYSGNGTLTIANGGSVSASAVTIASQAGSSGTINFGSLGGSDTAGNLIAPLISFGSGSGTINFNQADALAASGFSGNGNINQLGSGTTILTGTNTYSGTTTVSAGTLVAYGQPSLGTSSVVVNGGTLMASGTFTHLSLTFNTGALVLTGVGSSYDNSGDTLFIGNNSPGVSLLVSNGATVTNQGWLILGNNGGSSNNTVAVSGNGSSVRVNSVAVGYCGSENSFVVSKEGGFVSSGANIGQGFGGYCSNNSVLVTGAGSIWNNSGSLDVSRGTYSTGNSLTVANGGSVISDALSIAQYYGGASGSMNIGRFGTNDTAGTIAASSIYVGTGGAINFNQSDTATMTSSIIGWNAGGFINQLGSGTTMLTGNNNAYNGVTTVSAGTLLANSSNALGTSKVTVTNSGTLGGNGTITGATTVASGGTLAPGLDGVGSLSFTGGLSLESGSTTSFTIHSANDFTSINLIGSSVTYGGKLVFNLVNFTPSVGNEFTVFNMTGGAGESGNFATVVVGGSYLSGTGNLWSGSENGVTYQFNDSTGKLTVQAVPEPSTWALLGLGALGMLIAYRRRKLG